MGREGRARVEEHADEDGRDGERQDVDAQHVVAYHERNEHREDRDHGVEHDYAARLLEVVLAEQAQVSGEKEDERAHEQYLPGDGRGHGAYACAAPLGLALEGVEHAVSVAVNYFAAVDDFLPAQDHAACKGYSAQDVAQLGLAALFVVDKVGLYVFVEVAPLQHLPLGGELRVGEESFVGGHR